MKNKLLTATIVVATLAIAVSLFAGGNALPIPPFLAPLLRWLGIVLIAANAIRRRSLTSWILVGLLAGAELGHDAPAIALKLQFLGIVFLRLIKTIIAPLLFGTLVVGFAAINISRAGEGVRLPPVAASESLNAAPHTATQLITDIFPENIAKSVAEGQVLQVV